MTRKPKADLIKSNIKPGDYVLCGSSYASFPGHWYLGEVLWASRTDLLINQSSMNGDSYRRVIHVEEVRAFGTIAELVAIQTEARKAVADLVRQADEIESALGSARGAVHAKLEELAAGGLKISPLDMDAIEARNAETRRAVEACDAEAVS